MELLQLRYFLTAAKLEHITKAAEELHIAQPALSRTIHRLEKDLGMQLFDRQGRHIKLNPFGKAFAAKVKAALHLLDEGRREVEDLSGLKQGRIHLAVMNIELVKEPLQCFLAEHPDVNFHIVHSSVDDLENMESTQEIDFLLTSMPIKQEGFNHLPLVREELYLAVPHGNQFAGRAAIDLKEAAAEPFVSYKENSPLRVMNDELCRSAGFLPNIVCETEDPGNIAELVRSGFGVAIVGGCKGAEELGLVKLPIRKPHCARMFRIAWREERYLSQAATAFRSFIVEYFKKEQSSASKKVLMLR